MFIGMSRITLSFNRYALLLVLAVGAIYLGLAVLGAYQYEVTKDAIVGAERQAADTELRDAFRKAIADLHQGADTLAEWDELFQQLSSPVYFSYWYSHRILNKSGIDSRFTDLMVYDAQGKALGAPSDSPLPRHLDHTDRRDKFSPDGKDVRLTVHRELRRESEGEVLGYLVVQARLLPNVMRLHGFSRIGVGSIDMDLQEPTSDPDRIYATVKYQIQPTPSVVAMDDLVLYLAKLLGAAVLLPTLLLVFLFSRHVGNAVQQVPKVVDALREKGVDKAIETAEGKRLFRIQELEIAEHSLIEYHLELSSANATLDEKNQELWSLAHRDVLTGAQNRRAFDNFWQTLQSMNERHARRLRVMLVDVNRFKAINDTYGHEVGDSVLKAIVACLHQAIRRDEQLFRLGGDEFACVLLDCDDRHAMLVASRCEHAVANYPFAEQLGIREPVRLSIGISPAANDSHVPAKTLLRQADLAMYHSKKPSSGSICIYRESLESQAGAVFSNSINEAVYRVIEQGEGVVMYYQPVFLLNEYTISYYEALLRIDNGGQLIFPNEIMPVVESRHLEKEMDQAVIDQILTDLYNGVVPVGTGISINLSAASISDDGIIELLDPFRPFISDYKLVLEVTETALITQMEVANSHMMQLRNLGFLVALDDFGSGYSSLTYLTTMPVDIVKFDITLIRSLGDDTHRRLVEHLLEFISSAGQATVAEGVEDEASLQRVREIGFNYVQGYLWGKPELLSPIPRISASPG